MLPCEGQGSADCLGCGAGQTPPSKHTMLGHNDVLRGRNWLAKCSSPWQEVCEGLCQDMQAGKLLQPFIEQARMAQCRGRESTSKSSARGAPLAQEPAGRARGHGWPKTLLSMAAAPLCRLEDGAAPIVNLAGDGRRGWVGTTASR